MIIRLIVSPSHPTENASKSCPPPTSANNCCLANTIRPASTSSSNLTTTGRPAMFRTPLKSPPGGLRGPGSAQQHGLANQLSSSSLHNENNANNTQSNSNTQQQVQIDVGFRECPFHFIRTEWYKTDLFRYLSILYYIWYVALLL